MTKEVDYENPWIYEGAPFTSDDIGEYYGFVYRITNTTTQKSYIGRKYFYQKRKPRGGKRKVTSESDWKRYYGSSDDLKQDIRSIGRGSCRREILSLHTTLGKVNYEETKQLFLHNVLTIVVTLNLIILLDLKHIEKLIHILMILKIEIIYIQLTIFLQLKGEC